MHAALVIISVVASALKECYLHNILSLLLDVHVFMLDVFYIYVFEFVGARGIFFLFCFLIFFFFSEIHSL